MSTISTVPRLPGKRVVLGPLFIALGLLIIAAILIPDLRRSKPASVPFPSQSKVPASLSTKAEVPVHFATNRMVLAGEIPPAATSSASFNRKIVRTGSLQAVVKSPVDAAEKLRIAAEGLGGYVENLQMNADQGAPTANLTLRIPASRLEDAKAEFRKLAIHVDNEQSNASDVTRQYVDLEARIRNLRAEEAQYLTIMKSASKVKDMLEVGEKISGVRGEIEQQQAEFATLLKQVDTVALTISLRAEPVAPVATEWRPLYELQLAAREALDGLANYATTMMGVILEIPVILLWVVTIVLGAAAGWKGLRWVARVFFSYPKQQPV
jgi:Domain of unknown function (DUF4349)